ncbi:MAG: hypothetical protein K0U68_15860 [Gammaproteobacteria bacterium]|nr:hypothetical protein [Gammaproteobacteria bacterium]
MNFLEAMKNYLYLIVIFVSLVSSQARAQEYGQSDEKTYPGSACVFQQWDLINDRKYNGFGAIENRNINYSVDVVCPIVRDNVESVNGIKRLVVYYEDQHPYRYRDVLCYVSSWDAYKDSVQERSDHYRSNRLENGVGKGSFWMDYPILKSTSSSFYTLNCTLPGKYQGKASSIISFSVVE